MSAVAWWAVGLLASAVLLMVVAVVAAGREPRADWDRDLPDAPTDPGMRTVLDAQRWPASRRRFDPDPSMFKEL